MSLFKFMKAVIFITILALIYIHMQLQIIALAYEGKKREQEIVSISERNGVLAYEILSLKSANNLGEKVLGNQTRLKFRDNENVVNIVTAKPEVTKDIALANVKTSKGNPLLNLFSKAGAEANAAERTDDVIKPWRRSR